MKYFFRVILLSLRYKWTIIASVVNALLIAMLWGASISTIYPLMEVVFEGETIHNWVEEAIADSQAQSNRLEQEIADIRRKLRQATPEEETQLRAKIVIREGVDEVIRRCIDYGRALRTFVD